MKNLLILLLLFVTQLLWAQPQSQIYVKEIDVTNYVTTLENQVIIIPSLNATITALENQVATIPGLNAIVTALESQVATIPGLNATVTALESQVATIPGLNATVTSLTQVNVSQSNKIIELTTQLANCVNAPVVDKPFFQSDFEDATLNGTHIIGNSWNIFTANPIIGDYNIVTEAYNLTAAYPEIINFEGNKKLHFVILKPVGDKARVQGSFSFNVDTIKEYRSQYKFYISKNIEKLKLYTTGVEYLKFSEIWEEHNDAWDGNTAGQAYWRFGLRTNPLTWFYDGYYKQPESMNNRLLLPRQINSTIPIPFGKWAVLDYTFHPGEGTSGHVKITLTVDGVTSVLFDITGNTTYPGNHLPVGWYQPMKLYMPAVLANYIGTDISIYYDDFKLWIK